MSSSWRKAAVVGVLALAAGGVLGYAVRGLAQPANQPPPAAAPAKTVEAERFVLKSPTGRAIATLDNAPDDTPILALFDKNGKTRLQVTLSPTGDPLIVFSDKDGKGTTSLPAK